MDDLQKLERDICSVYAKVLSLLASRFNFDLPVNSKDVPGPPRVLFLGNHSSGKSSFINHLIREDLQESGLAPTDDGFTLITHGVEPDTLDGQTAVTHPDLDYHHFADLGPNFLARLKLKVHPADILKSITLIDSPGMIDSVDSMDSRIYDFEECVRRFAESADLILFFFDPDKPGTTGEAVSIFTNQLSGLEYKLLIILNKVDLFQNIRDFARTYGTLCWNLSKTIGTKDTPHIYTTYLPDRAQRPHPVLSKTIALEDFDASREEITAEIKRAPTRRADNLVSDLLNHSRRLAVHVRVCMEAASAYKRMKTRLVLGVFLGLGVAWMAAWLFREYWFNPAWLEAWNNREFSALKTPGLILLSLLGALAALWTAGMFFLWKIRNTLCTPEGMEAFFHKAFKREISLRKRADLYALWESGKARALHLMQTIGPGRISTSFSTRRLLKRLNRTIDQEIPRLRRKIGLYRGTATNSEPSEVDVEPLNRPGVVPLPEPEGKFDAPDQAAAE